MRASGGTTSWPEAGFSQSHKFSWKAIVRQCRSLKFVFNIFKTVKVSKRVHSCRTKRIVLQWISNPFHPKVLSRTYKWKFIYRLHYYITQWCDDCATIESGKYQKAKQKVIFLYCPARCPQHNLHESMCLSGCWLLIPMATNNKLVVFLFARAELEFPGYAIDIRAGWRQLSAYGVLMIQSKLADLINIHWNTHLSHPRRAI